MLNAQLLEKKIEQSGFRINHIVDTLGMSKAGFYKKKKGTIPFRAAEIYVLSDLLKLSEAEKQDIFFADKVE